MPPSNVGMRIMMFRAVVCCAALIVGLLAALNVAAQSASVCSNGATCNASGKAPLNLMNFMNGSGQTGAAKAGAAPAPAKTAATKHRHPTKTAARSNSDVVPLASEPPALSAAAATAFAAHSPDDVQVVSGDEVNAIDLAMGNAGNSTAETNGAAPDTDNRDRTKWADASEFRTEQFNPVSAPAPANEPTSTTTIRDDSWMGRFWSTIGDGYVALIAMIKQLFS